MKKIISGKLYDTETAKEIAVWNNGRSYSDFSHCVETLYKKRTGEYFCALCVADFHFQSPFCRYQVR